MTAKDLKNAVLQEAVQGKLVPQIASEGNARDLLEEIRKSHTDLQIPTESAGNKKGDLRSKSQIRVIKKEKILPEITDDEVPFDIPESWCWCRLGDVFQTTSGTTPQSKNPLYYDNGTIGWVRTTDLNNGILSEAEILITEKAKSDCNLKMIPKNSVCMALYGGGGTIGKNALLNFETTINQSVCALLPNKFADMKYLHFFLQWQRPLWMDYASGSRKDPNINQIIVKNCPFPLPPLSEQKRIVAAIEKFMPLIEEYGKKETVLNELNAQIGTLTKKAILQEAVQGKLVPQIPAEGNAKDLLEQIKAQKTALIKEGRIKKEKPLPEITEDEIPFDIPESWCWCRLGDVTSFNGGYAFKSEKYTSNGIRVLRISDFNETGIVNKSPVYYPKTLDLECYKIQDNDIVMCMTGGTVGKTYHFKKLEEEYYVNQRVADLKCSNLINDDYVYLVIQNSYIKRRIDECKNSTNDNISADLIKSFAIPLPPLSEQKRIVAAIEQLLPLCEKLGK